MRWAQDLWEATTEAFKRAMELLHFAYITYVLAGFGIAASLLSIIPQVNPKIGKIADYFIPPIFALILISAHYLRRKLDKPILIPADVKMITYTIETKPAIADTLAGLRILHEHFGADTIPHQVFLEAQIKNPNCIVIAKNEGGEVVGIGDFHGLEASIFSRFKSGEIGEAQFSANNFLTISEMSNTDEFYLGGISISKRWRHKEGEIAQAIGKGMFRSIWRTYKHHHHHNETFRLNIYSLGATPQGCKSLEAHGFFRFSEKTENRPFPMYTRVMNLRELRHLKNRSLIGLIRAKVR